MEVIFDCYDVDMSTQAKMVANLSRHINKDPGLDVAMEAHVIPFVTCHLTMKLLKMEPEKIEDMEENLLDEAQELLVS